MIEGENKSFNYEFVARSFGLPKIFLDGYEYICHTSVKRYQHKYWRCQFYVQAGCKARAILNKDRSVSVKRSHTHPPLTNEERSMLMFVSKSDVFVQLQEDARKSGYGDGYLAV